MYGVPTQNLRFGIFSKKPLYTHNNAVLKMVKIHSIHGCILSFRKTDENL